MMNGLGKRVKLLLGRVELRQQGCQLLVCQLHGNHLLTKHV